MAAKRAMDIILNGEVGTLPRAVGRAQAWLNRYSRSVDNTQRRQQALGRSTSALGKMMGGSLVRSAAGYAAAFVGAQQLVQGVKGTIQAYQQAVTEENRLSQLMTTGSKATRAQVAAMKLLAEQRQRITTIDDEATKRGMGQLATFQLQVQSIRKLTPALQDLAVGQYGANVSADQMQQTANLLGKVFTGQTGALRRLGITFDKHQERLLRTGTESQRVATLQAVIAQNYGGIAERMAQTPEGRVIQLANAWGDVKEQIGGALSPLVMKVLGYLARIMPFISKGVDLLVAKVGKFAPAFKPLEKAPQVLLRIFRPIIDVIVNKVWPLVKQIIGNIVAIFKEAWPQIQPALQKLGAAIGSLLSAIVPIARWLWNSILKPVLGFVVKTVLPMVISLISTIVSWVAKLITKLSGAFDWFKQIWTKVKEIGKLLFNNGPLGIAIRAGKWVTEKVAGKRAAGGPVAAGRSYLVGERGPELFTPSLSGRISPNMALAGPGSISVTFAPVIHTGSGADRNEVAAGIRTAYDEFKANFRRMMQEERRRTF